MAIFSYRALLACANTENTVFISTDTPRPCDMNNVWDDIYPGNQCYKLFEQKLTAEDAM